MNNSQNSKSILARTLATENIQVEYSSVASTAMFDVANRVLTLPVWENMSESVRDMFIGHEIGHALFTPFREIDKTSKGGWVKDAERIGGTANASYVQGLFNVVEDVRIEKMIKDKYPGFRRDFSIGYKELIEADFFGTKDKDIKDFSFGDRINLHFKGGASMNVQFSIDEQPLVDLVDSCKTFDDMIAAVEKIYEFINGEYEDRDEQTEPSEPQSTFVYVQIDQNGTNESFTPDTNGSVDDKEDEQDGKNDSEGKKQSNAPKGGTGLAKEGHPKMTTQDAFDAKTQTFVDKSTTGVSNCILGVPNIARIVLPFAKTSETLSNHFAKSFSIPTSGALMKKFCETKLQKLIQSSNVMIGTIIKQFEMRKAADVQKRTSISKRGRIDCDRIFKYKVSDDIFSRFATVAAGKNHGLVMYVDWSSSMQPMTQDVLNQIIILTRFCKKMGIPFDVYLFSSQYPVLDTHLGLSTQHTNNDKYQQWKTPTMSKTQHSRYCNTPTEYTKVPTEPFALIQVLSSDMSSRQFSEGLFNLFCLGQLTNRMEDIVTECNVRGANGIFDIPSGFTQGNTPLDPTILAALYMVPAFQAKHKVQVVNTIFLTDGDSGHRFFNPSESRYSEKSFVKTSQHGKEYMADDMTSTDTLLEILSDQTKTTTIGFYISCGRGCRYFPYDDNSSYTQLSALKTFKDNGFFDAPKLKASRQPSDNAVYNSSTQKYSDYIKVKNHGYTHLFILPTKQEIVSDMDLLDNLADGSTIAKIRNTFLSIVEKRGNSKSFLNRFADVIAAPNTR